MVEANIPRRCHALVKWMSSLWGVVLGQMGQRRAPNGGRSTLRDFLDGSPSPKHCSATKKAGYAFVAGQTSIRDSEDQPFFFFAVVLMSMPGAIC
jgi:hypothetical protein